VAAYLADLDRALAGADPSDRLEIVDAVREHIDASLTDLGASPTQAEVAGVLRRLGTADEVAAAWAVGADRPLRQTGAGWSAPQLRPSAHGLVPVPPGEATAGTSPWLVALVVLLGLLVGIPLVLGLLSLVLVATGPVGVGAAGLLVISATVASGIAWRRATKHRGAWLAAFVVGIALCLGTAALGVRVYSDAGGQDTVHGGLPVDVVPTPSPASDAIPLRVP
jgi:hypothetical protein